MKKLLLLVSLFTVATLQITAQCMLTPVLLNQRLINSTHVVEGKVIDKKCFWDASHQHIYTSNLVEVYKTFKNNTTPFVEVITLGGQMPDRISVVEPSLQLGIGDEGVFTLNVKELPQQFGNTVYEPYADAQGFIRYSVLENTANEPFKTYSNISFLYNELNKLTGVNYTNVKSNTFVTLNKPQQVAAALITSFSPTTAISGAGVVLTINGSGFGTTRGTSFVEFTNANNSSSVPIYFQPYSIDYVSWSDTQIKVKVPSTSASPSGCAGTGLIRVDVAGAKTISTDTLKVPYSMYNLYYSAAPATIYAPYHQNMNGGGYELPLYTGFNANAPAKAAFKRALDTWRCGTKINWRSTTTTTVNVEAGDYYSVIRFDVGNELPAGTLARTTNWSAGCGTNPSAIFVVDEIDIVFDDAVNWGFGPNQPLSNESDFESVALHELGHGHNIWHVLDSASTMHPAIYDGASKRTLSASALAAGNAVMARNATATNLCGGTKIVPVNATSCALTAPISSINVSTVSCQGLPITLKGDMAGSITSWAWSMPGGSPSTANTQTTQVTYATSGVKTISLTTTNNIGATTSTSTFTVDVCTGLTNLSVIDNFLIYPNPSTGIFTLQHDGSLTVTQITLVNALGQEVYTTLDTQTKNINIDLSNLNSGIYYIKITSNKSISLSKLIKQ